MRTLLLTALLALAACGGEEKDTVGKEIADDYQHALDKAADVEQQAQDAKDRVDAALDEARDAVKD